MLQYITCTVYHDKLNNIKKKNKKTFNQHDPTYSQNIELKGFAGQSSITEKKKKEEGGGGLTELRSDPLNGVQLRECGKKQCV